MSVSSYIFNRQSKRTLIWGGGAQGVIREMWLKVRKYNEGRGVLVKVEIKAVTLHASLPHLLHSMKYYHIKISICSYEHMYKYTWCHCSKL
jgi:hypothetical protein